MESNEDDLTTLRQAELARDALAADITMPHGYDESIGIAVAFQIATTALGAMVKETWAWVLLVVGVVAFAIVAGMQISRFRRVNGVRVSGFVSKVVLGSATTASVGYVVALVVAMLAAYHEQWWLVALAGACGGVVYVLSGRRWLRAYRQEPARLGRGESALWFGLLLALAVAGLALLVVNR